MRIEGICKCSRNVFNDYSVRIAASRRNVRTWVYLAFKYHFSHEFPAGTWSQLARCVHLLQDMDPSAYPNESKKWNIPCFYVSFDNSYLNISIHLLGLFLFGLRFIFLIKISFLKKYLIEITSYLDLKF